MIVDIETLVKAEISINQYLLACFIVENNQDGFIEYVNACGKFHERDVQMLINNKYLIYTGDGTTYNFYELHPTKRLDDLTKTMREEELFSAARTEFKHLEYFYFHNFLYESVWKNNIRRFNERTSTLDLMHKYGHDYKLVFVGDASMSPYEIMQPGGSVEHWNEESGELWMRRLRETYEKCIWINPVPEDEWEYTQSISITRQLMEGNMYPLTLRGLEEGMSFLSK